MRRVYLDHNATTDLRPECRDLWLEVAGETGNASSLHAAGRRARQHVDQARERVARALGVREDELVFTSGGTEANNLVIQGALAPRPPGEGLATGAAEHSSVLAAARSREDAGRPVHVLAVDEHARPDPAALGELLERERLGLVSIQAANNEVGSMPHLASFAERVRALGAPRPWLHTDAAQALGKVPVDLDAWGVDLATFSAHKLGGPPGVGFVWRREVVPLAPLLHGGGQEGALRPGTEDAAGIAAAALAVELAVADQEAFRSRTLELARDFWRTLRARLPAVRLLGPPLDDPERLPNTLALLFPETDGKVLVTRLDLEGLEVSAGSACASGSLEPSHVLSAMGWSEDEARAGLRVSLGRDTSAADCAFAVDVLQKTFRTSRAT